MADTYVLIVTRRRETVKAELYAVIKKLHETRMEHERLEVTLQVIEDDLQVLMDQAIEAEANGKEA
jgi:hypothetical protein